MRTWLLLGSWITLAASAPAQDSVAAAQDSAVATQGSVPATRQDVGAGAREVPRVAREVIDNVLSPYCPGLLLANCPSPQADSLRKAITERARDGESRASIEADLLASYGEAVRAAPLGSGLGLAAWFTPGIAVLLGGIFIALWLRRRTAPAPVPVPAAPLRQTPTETAAADDMTARINALVRDDSSDDEEY